MIYQNCPKNQFYIQFHVLFFTNNKVVPLGFFHFLDQNSWLINFDENVKTTLGYFVF